MKLLAFIGVVALATQTGLLAEGKSFTPAQREVIAVDKTWADFYQACNVDGMNKLLAGDMVFVHIGGNQQNKAQFVETVRPCSMEAVSTDVSSVRLYGTTAIVIGTMNYKVKNMAAGVIIYTRVYLKDGAGKWSLVTHESTAQAAPRAPKS